LFLHRKQGDWTLHSSLHTGRRKAEANIAGKLLDITYVDDDDDELILPGGPTPLDLTKHELLEPLGAEFTKKGLDELSS
jgi:hypothetical protein